MGYYPIFLELSKRRCAVVGGGNVAERKVESLLVAGAEVWVIAPRLTPGLQGWLGEGRIRHVARAYRAGDLAGHEVVFVATDEGKVNDAVAEEARSRGIWINAADDPAHCDFIIPSVLRRGDLTVAVGTSGASPAVSRLVREELESHLSRDYADLLRIAAEVRQELREAYCHPSAEAWQRALKGDVRRLLREGEAVKAKVRLREELERSAHEALPLTPGVHDSTGGGKVYLVGAGPGNPELLTVRARDLLDAADVVVYDRLVNPLLVEMSAAKATRIFAGKERGRHLLPQEEINRILIDHARRGSCVVRLKGGDPFVFGRGGEEAQALAAAGIPFEVVPGVSSVTAVAAYAGIPLTFRKVSSSFAVVTGHEAIKSSPSVDWKGLATAVDTLVIVMGLTHLPHIVAELLTHGRAAETPVALIRSGTTESQETVTGTLADICEKGAALKPPALAVIGEVVRLREELNWFGEFAAGAAGGGLFHGVPAEIQP